MTLEQCADREVLGENGGIPVGQERSAGTVGATARAVEALSDTIAGAPLGEEVAHSWLGRLRRVSPPMCARLAS